MNEDANSFICLPFVDKPSRAFHTASGRSLVPLEDAFVFVNVSASWCVVCNVFARHRKIFFIAKGRSHDDLSVFHRILAGVSIHIRRDLIHHIGRWLLVLPFERVAVWGDLHQTVDRQHGSFRALTAHRVGSDRRIPHRTFFRREVGQVRIGSRCRLGCISFSWLWYWRSG